MSTISTWNFTEPDLEATGAFIFRETITELNRNGFLTDDQRDEILDNYLGLYHRKGAWNRVLDKFFKKEVNDNSFAFTMMKHGKGKILKESEKVKDEEGGENES